MANSYLTKTFGSAGSLTTWTLSFWVKKAGNGIEQRIFSCDDDASGNNDQWMKFDGSDIIQFSQYQSGYTQKIETNRKFRDNNGYYHIVLVWDTTNSTAADRTRLYVNGVRETSFSSEIQASSSLGSLINNTTYPLEIGRRGNNNTQFFSGYMSHIAFVDGTALAPTVFGETDSTSGIWKFKSPSGVTWGTNGFHLKMENSAALGTDSSGNTNTFTVNGNLKQTIDTPSNVYPTWNANLRPNSTASFAHGNLKQTTNSSHQDSVTASGFSTFGMTKGKWYAEFKVNAVNWTMLGVSCDLQMNQQGGSSSMYNFIYNNKGFAYYSVNGNCFHTNQNTSVSYGNSYTTNDIIGIALDLDNKKLYFSKNGVWQNSGNPTSGSTGTGSTQAAGTIALPDSDGKGNKEYFFCHADFDQSAQSQVSANFGAGVFGNDAIASAGSNGNGSLFEYDCPSGYYALNTKNINTYG